MPNHSARTIASLVFTGTLARFPQIRFVFSHGLQALGIPAVELHAIECADARALFGRLRARSAG